MACKVSSTLYLPKLFERLGEVGAVWRKRSGSQEGSDVGMESELVGDTSSSEGVEEVKRGSVKEIEVDEESFE